MDRGRSLRGHSPAPPSTAEQSHIGTAANIGFCVPPGLHASFQPQQPWLGATSGFSKWSHEFVPRGWGCANFQNFFFSCQKTELMFFLEWFLEGSVIAD